MRRRQEFTVCAFIWHFFHSSPLFIFNLFSWCGKLIGIESVAEMFRLDFSAERALFDISKHAFNK